MFGGIRKSIRRRSPYTYITLRIVSCTYTKPVRRSSDRAKILSIKWILVAADNMSVVNHTIQFDVKAVDNGVSRSMCRATEFYELCLCQIPFFGAHTHENLHHSISRWEEGWVTRHKAVYCIMYICNHPLALLAHAIQCLELHVTHFCLLFTLFIVQNNFRCATLHTYTYTHKYMYEVARTSLFWFCRSSQGK